MILVEIAAYILFITLILFYSTRILWLFFLLFCYRFWESIITKEFMAKHVHLIEARDYYIALIIISVLTYFGVMFATKAAGMEFGKYIILVAMALYVIRQPQYTIKEVFFFKDYLEAHGMWNIDFWIQKVRELFTSSDKDKIGIFQNIWDGIKEVTKRFFGYIQKL